MKFQLLFFTFKPTGSDEKFFSFHHWKAVALGGQGGKIPPLASVKCSLWLSLCDTCIATLIIFIVQCYKVKVNTTLTL